MLQYQDQQKLQAENYHLRQELAVLSAATKNSEEKYQKSLKEISIIIQANRNLKLQLDELKRSFSERVDLNARDSVRESQRRFDSLLREKNELHVSYENIERENEQLLRKVHELEKQSWEVESLKKQLEVLSKEKESLLLEKHPLTRSTDNPEHKMKEEKLERRIEEQNVEIHRLMKNRDCLTLEKQEIQKKLDSKIAELSHNEDKLSKVEDQISHKKTINEKSSESMRRIQQQNLGLRKNNAELMNKVQKMKIEALVEKSQKSSEENEAHLLNTLKSLYSQLEPMRYEIEELKRDKFYEHENYKNERTELKTKLLSFEHENQALKKYLKEIEERNHELSAQTRERTWEKQRIIELQEDKKLLEGRVIVYEAMELVAKNRDYPSHIERIQQFERRIQLLLEEEDLPQLVNNANVHQLIAMKAYVLELDGKIQEVVEQNAQVTKRYSHYKEKYQQVVHENKQIIQKHNSMVSGYKSKVNGYEKLVLKLTGQLENYLKSNDQSYIQKTSESIISLYETQITSLHQELSLKREEYRENMKRVEMEQIELKSRVAILKKNEEECEELRRKNSELGAKIMRLQSESQNFMQIRTSPKNNSSEEVERYKMQVISKSRVISQLEEELEKYKKKMLKESQENYRDLENIRERYRRLEKDNDGLKNEIYQLRRNHDSSDIQNLVSKITHLERSILIQQEERRKSHEPELSISPHELVSIEEFNRVKNENTMLREEIDTVRQECKTTIMSKNNAFNVQTSKYADEIYALREEKQSMILKLRQSVMELEYELSIKNKQIQFLKKDVSRAEQTMSTQMAKPASDFSPMEEENTRLKSEIERMRMKNQSLTLEYDDLVRKIKEMEQYLLNTKKDCDQVMQHMHDLEKESHDKDNLIRELETKGKILERRVELHKQDELTRSRLETKISEHDILIRRLKDQLISQEQSSQVSQRELERRLHELQLHEKDVNERYNSLSARFRELEERESVINRKQESLTRLQNQLMYREKKMNVSERSIPESNTVRNEEIEVLKAEFYDIEKQIIDLKNTISEQKRTIFDLEDQLRDSLLREKKTERELLMKTSELEAQLSRSSLPTDNSATTERINELLSQVHKLEEAIMTKNSLLSLQESKIKILEERSPHNNNNTSSKTITNNDNDNGNGNDNVEEITLLREELSGKDELIELKDKNIGELLKEKKEMLERLKEQESRIEELSSLLELKDENIESLFREKKELVIRMQEFAEVERVLEDKDSLIGIKDANIAELFQEKKDLSQQISQLTHQLQDNASLLDLKDAQISELFQFKKHHTEELSHKAQQQSLESMESLLQLKDAQISELFQEKKKMLQQISDLSAELTDREELVEMKDRNIEELFQEKKRFVEKVQEMEVREAEEVSLLQMKDETIDGLLREKREMEVRIGEMQGKMQGDSYYYLRCNELEKLNKQLEEKYEKILHETRLETETTIRTLRIQISDLSHKLSASQPKSEQPSRNQPNDQTPLLQEKQRIVNALRVELEARATKIESMSREIESMRRDTGDNGRVYELEREISQLREALHNQSHHQCQHKENELRRQIARLHSSIPHTEPPHPENSYLLHLQETNSQLEQDLSSLRAHLIQSMDSQRTVESYLTILLLTFVEVDALRSRMTELEANFKKEHELHVASLKFIEKIKEYNDEDVKGDFLRILEELQVMHQTLHQDEEKSRQVFISKIHSQEIQNVAIAGSVSDIGSGISSMEEEIRREKNKRPPSPERAYMEGNRKITEVSEPGSEMSFNNRDRTFGSLTGIGKKEEEKRKEGGIGKEIKGSGGFASYITQGLPPKDVQSYGLISPEPSSGNSQSIYSSIYQPQESNRYTTTDYSYSANTQPMMMSSSRPQEQSYQSSYLNNNNESKNMFGTGYGTSGTGYGNATGYTSGYTYGYNTQGNANTQVSAYGNLMANKPSYSPEGFRPSETITGGGRIEIDSGIKSGSLAPGELNRVEQPPLTFYTSPVVTETLINENTYSSSSSINRQPQAQEQNLVPYRFYQQSQSSIQFPSERSFRSKDSPDVMDRSRQSSHSPYMFSNSRLYK